MYGSGKQSYEHTYKHTDYALTVWLECSEERYKTVKAVHRIF